MLSCGVTLCPPSQTAWLSCPGGLKTWPSAWTRRCRPCWPRSPSTSPSSRCSSTRRMTTPRCPTAGWGRDAGCSWYLGRPGLGDRINQLFHCRHDTPWKHRDVYQTDLYVLAKTQIKMWLWALRRASFVSQISDSFLFNLAAFFDPPAQPELHTREMFFHAV